MKSVLVRPIISEKSMQEAVLGRFTFEVEKEVNKPEIAKAIEKAFSVKVINVSTIMVKSKAKRSLKTRSLISGRVWKKAIVTLLAGQKIELFDVTEKGSTNKN